MMFHLIGFALLVLIVMGLPAGVQFLQLWAGGMVVLLFLGICALLVAKLISERRK